MAFRVRSGSALSHGHARAATSCAAAVRPTLPLTHVGSRRLCRLSCRRPLISASRSFTSAAVSTTSMWIGELKAATREPAKPARSHSTFLLAGLRDIGMGLRDLRQSRSKRSSTDARVKQRKEGELRAFDHGGSLVAQGDTGVAGWDTTPPHNATSFAFATHHAACVADGRVYTVGRGYLNELGHDTKVRDNFSDAEEVKQSIWKRVDGVSIKEPAKRVYTAHTSTFILLENGRVLRFGAKFDGLATNILKYIPEKYFEGEKIRDVALGSTFALMVTETGKLFSFGQGFGTGHGQPNSYFAEPKRVELDGPVTRVIARGHNVLATIEDYQSSLLSWGRNEEHQGGRGASAGTDTIAGNSRPAEFLHQAIDFDLSATHSIVLGADGGVRQWNKEMIGDVVPFEKDVRIKKVVAGDGFSAALTEDGKIYRWRLQSAPLCEPFCDWSVTPTLEQLPVVVRDVSAGPSVLALAVSV